MKNIKILSLVSSQFQIKNSIEVSKKYLGEELSIMFFVLNPIHDMQMQLFANERDLNVIGKIYMKKFFQYFKLAYKIFSIRTNFTIDNLIVGHSQNNLMMFSVRFLNFKKLIFVDDGEILDLINSKDALNFYKERLPINYYTIFNLKSTKSINIINYNYEIFRSEVKKQKSESCLFIGSCYVETNLISESLYLELLRKIIKKEKFIKYICHPREELKKFQGLKGIKIIKPKIGIENYLETLNYFPKKTIGFYSAAFVSLYNCFPHLSGSLFIIDLRKYFKISSTLNNGYEYALSNFKEYVL